MATAFDIDRPLPEGAQKGIEAVAKSSKKLIEIMGGFEGREPEFSAGPVFEIIGRELETTYSEVSRIFSAIEVLSELKQSAGGADQLMAWLAKRLTPSRAQEVQTNQVYLVDLLRMYDKNNPVALSIKAEKLGHLHENLYHDAEIITDARPIFDADGANVLEFIITHSFVLRHYSFGSNAKRVHFAMDSIDVLRLRDACDRAIKKAGALKSALGEKWTVKILNERSGDA